MSKVLIKYDLSNEDDEMELKRAMKSNDMAMFIWELQHNFWRKWKHEDEDFNLETYKEELSELLEDHNINIDELIN